ncbi:MAG: MmcB family DNA repair protein [Acidimicrobiales bacterium]
MTSASTALSAADVRDALHCRWPDGDYIVIEEAPDGVARLGRKLDLLAMSTWRSRGFELDGVEIKVSVSDWKRELKDAEKADWWWRHVHRFWVAVPAEIAERVKGDLPATWGLLAVSGGVARVVVKAPRHDAARLGWDQCLGLLRAASKAGVGALQRAESRGYQHGAESASKVDGDDRLRRELDALQVKVAAFEKASGIGLAHTWGAEDAARVGRCVASVQKGFGSPERTVASMLRSADELGRIGDALRNVAGELAGEIGGVGAGNGTSARSRRRGGA